MTPARQPQQQPKEYIITEDQVRMFEARGLHWLGRLVRTRPHTPAAPAKQQCPYWVIARTAHPDGDKNEWCFNTQAIRKAAREQAIEKLSEINRYSCEEYEEASLSDNEREMRIHLEYGNRTWGIIRSLRGGGADDSR